MSTKRPCFFCHRMGHSKWSTEHVFPNWIFELFPDKADTDMPVGSIWFYSKTGQRDQQSWHAKGESGFKIKVCKRCNEGWMSDLESGAQPVLGALITGDLTPRQLASRQQLTISEWVVKTAMAIEPLKRGRVPVFFSTVERARFSDQCAIPVSVVCITAARYTGTQFLLVSFSTVPYRIVNPTRPNKSIYSFGHTITFGIGGLALQLHVGRFPGGMSGLPMLHGPWRETTRDVWPVSAAPVDWPPARPLDDEGFMFLSSKWTPPGVQGLVAHFDPPKR